MIAVAILGMWENDDYYPPRLESAIRQAAFARNRSVDITLEVEEELMDSPDEILWKMLDSGLENVTYGEFEKAFSDPDADPELLAKVYDEMDMDEDISVTEIQEELRARENMPIVRDTLPYVLNVSVKFESEEE
jgi:hypothetical protein